MPKKYVGMFVGVYCPNCNAQTGLFNRDNKTGSPLMNEAHEKEAEQRYRHPLPFHRLNSRRT